MEKEVHIFATTNEDGQEWTHEDWFYKITIRIGANYKRIGKLYKSRAWASRIGKKYGKIFHWYPI